MTAAAPGDFGYAVTDDLRLRRRFGSAAQLRSLVRAAHALGIRVLLDVAANHLSDRSPYFLDAQRRGRASRYHDWFERDGAGKPVPGEALDLPACGGVILLSGVRSEHPARR